MGKELKYYLSILSVDGDHKMPFSSFIFKLLAVMDYSVGTDANLLCYLGTL